MSSTPPANSFVIGPAVINTHTHQAPSPKCPKFCVFTAPPTFTMMAHTGLGRRPRMVLVFGVRFLWPGVQFINMKVMYNNDVGKETPGRVYAYEAHEVK